MRLLAINASPRKGGNTDILIEKALDGARSLGAQTVKIDLVDMDISPINEKEYTDVTSEGFSVVDDDIHLIFDEIKRADALILGSPVFFGSVTAQLKAMIDRFQCAWIAKNINKKDIFPEKKRGGFICVQADSRNDFFQNASFIVRHFFATINAEYERDLFCTGLDDKGAVLKRTEYLEKAVNMGRELVEPLKEA
jgi:multimeric flavodoxin WrbA